MLNVGNAGHRRRHNSSKVDELSNSSQSVPNKAIYSNGSVYDSETTITPHNIDGLNIHHSSSHEQPAGNLGNLVLPKRLDEKKATTETSNLTDIVEFNDKRSYQKDEHLGKVLYSRDLLKDALDSTNAGRRRSIPSSKLRGRKEADATTTNNGDDKDARKDSHRNDKKLGGFGGNHKTHERSRSLTVAELNELKRRGVQL